MNYRREHQMMDHESIRRANDRARMRQFMQPGKGHRVNFWRRVARAVLRGLT